MVNYCLTNKAVEDLTGFWNYTYESWSENQADNYYNVLIDACQKIAENPTLGKRFDGVHKSLYGLNVNRHIIFYRKINAEVVEITRILHEMMDLRNRLEE